MYKTSLLSRKSFLVRSVGERQNMAVNCNLILTNSAPPRCQRSSPVLVCWLFGAIAWFHLFVQRPAHIVDARPAGCRQRYGCGGKHAIFDERGAATALIHVRTCQLLACQEEARRQVGRPSAVKVKRCFHLLWFVPRPRQQPRKISLAKIEGCLKRAIVVIVPQMFNQTLLAINY